MQATVKARFENLQESAKQKREFEIEDLDAEISILTTAYDKEIQRTLAHLSEQAAIAKKLGISKQVNIPPPSIYQSLNTQELNTIVDNTRKIDTKTPLYLRGYDALEKEAELIMSRQDKNAFIDDLLPFEQKKLILLKNKTPERAERLFAKTPVIKSDDFHAASFDVEATEFQYKSKPKLTLVLAAVFGGVIGMVYVLIASAMRSRRGA